MQKESERGIQTREVSDIAMATRNGRDSEIINNSKYSDTYNNNKPQIKTEIERQNERNNEALQNLAAQRAAANKALEVPEQKSEVSKNPPSITAPLTPVEKPIQQQPKAEAVPSNAPNNDLVKGINTIMQTLQVKPEQISEIKKALESKGYKVEVGKEPEAIAIFVQKNYSPDKVEALKKGDIGAAMSIIEELQKQTPAVPTPTNNNVANPLQMALNQFNTESSPSASTITGGQNVNGIKVGILPIDMRKNNEVGARIV